MKNFCFALPGMVVLLCLLGSCSNTDIESVKQEVIEAIEELQDDEAAAFEGTPVTKNGEEAPAAGKKPDASSPDAGAGNPPTDGSPNSGTPAGGTPKPPANVPSLLINELRTEENSYDAEFIELKMLSAGNLGGLRVFIASNNNNTHVFEFLPVEVKKDEYVLLHLFKRNAGCIDEYGEDLNESGGTDSSPTVRDFWISGKAELLDKDDAVYIMDQGGNVLDAVMIIKDSGYTSWSKVTGGNRLAEAAEFLFNKGAWKSAGGTIPSPADAVNLYLYRTNTSPSWSVSRYEEAEDTNTAADWYVTAAGGFTPGNENTKPK